MKKNKTLIYILVVLVGLVIANVISSKLYGRYDLTKDKRYTLSDATNSIINNIDSPLVIDVFLEGEFPTGTNGSWDLENWETDYLNYFPDGVPPSCNQGVKWRVDNGRIVISDHDGHE